MLDATSLPAMECSQHLLRVTLDVIDGGVKPSKFDETRDSFFIFFLLQQCAFGKIKAAGHFSS